MIDSVIALYIALPFVMGALLLQAALLVVNVKLELEYMNRLNKIRGHTIDKRTLYKRGAWGYGVMGKAAMILSGTGVVEGLKVLVGVLAIGLIVGAIVIAAITWWWLHGGWGT